MTEPQFTDDEQVIVHDVYSHWSDVMRSHGLFQKICCVMRDNDFTIPAEDAREQFMYPAHVFKIERLSHKLFINVCQRRVKYLSLMAFPYAMMFYIKPKSGQSIHALRTEYREAMREHRTWCRRKYGNKQMYTLVGKLVKASGLIEA